MIYCNFKKNDAKYLPPSKRKKRETSSSPSQSLDAAALSHFPPAAANLSATLSQLISSLTNTPMYSGLLFS